MKNLMEKCIENIVKIIRISLLIIWSVFIITSIVTGVYYGYTLLIKYWFQ